MATIDPELQAEIKHGSLEDYLDDLTWMNQDAAAVYATSHFTFAHILPPSQGALSARLTVSLPQNAVVDAFEIKIRAKRADQAVAADVAQLRGEPGEGANTHQIIVDFGTVRTVSAALFNLSARIELVDAWNGTEFPLYPYNSPFYDTDESRANPGFARFRSDVRTERLRITVVSTQSIGALLADLRLILPDSPKDLAITLDGGPPVWSLPGPTAKGTGSAPTTDGWSAQNERLVDLTGALQAVTGDPLTPADRSFELLLTSQEAGVLEITQSALSYRRIRRALFEGSETKSLAFEAEGQTDLPLTAPGTPAGAIARRITLATTGAFEADRRIPALGPDPAPLSLSDAGPLIECDITADRAVILRLSADSGLPSLTGLRLPLLAGPEGAELRLLPWENAGPGRVLPLSPLEDLTGDPVSLDPGGTGPVWTSLDFAAPLDLDPENPPWVALLVARGRVSVALSDQSGAAMLVGPPAGPWRSMPALFGTAPFNGLRFPYRAVGDAPEPTQPAPIALELAGHPDTGQAIDPAGAQGPLILDGLAAASPTLRITHFGAGTLDLGPIDIVSDT